LRREAQPQRIAAGQPHDEPDRRQYRKEQNTHDNQAQNPENLPQE
jgi:hypothetical protein